MSARRDDFLQERPTFLFLKVERDGELVPCFGEETRADLLSVLGLEHVLLAAEGGQLPERIAARRLDHDDLPAPLPEVRGAPVPGGFLRRAVQDPKGAQ